MKIIIIHPTRERTEQANLTARKWIDRANEAPEYWLSIDSNDKSDYGDKNWNGVSFITGSNKSAIEAINSAAKHVSTSSFKEYILIVVSDDTDCPEHWDTLLLNELKGKSDFCAKVNDGLQPTLVTMPIMDRVYYERYGYIYEPGYNHLFCDQELTAVSMMTGKYIKLPLTFNHLHYSTGQTPKDALNLRNDSTWYQGETLFNERLKTNFGIDNPVVPYSSIQWR